MNTTIFSRVSERGVSLSLVLYFWSYVLGEHTSRQTKPEPAGALPPSPSPLKGLLVISGQTALLFFCVDVEVYQNKPYVVVIFGQSRRLGVLFFFDAFFALSSPIQQSDAHIALFVPCSCELALLFCKDRMRWCLDGAPSAIHVISCFLCCCGGGEGGGKL